MKITYLLILVNLLLTNILISQKHDFKWLLGYHEGANRDSVIGHVMIDFNTTSGNIEYKVDKSKNIDFLVGNSLSMSDKNGNFLFSFNGFYIEDKKGKKVFNSDSICYYDECYASLQQSVILPFPVNDSVYTLFTI
ncbi:MAG: hypothetical protein ABIO44_05865, partial [Saprospiraceae bacterium]